MYTAAILFVIVATTLFAGGKPEIMTRLMLNPYQVFHKGQYYRFLTSGFIHNGYMHLFFNAFTLYFFGTFLERMIGGHWMLLLFLLAVIVSDIPTAIRYRDKPYYNSLGASGGVSAIVFACIMLNPLLPIRIFFIPIDIPGFILGSLYLLYSYYQSKREMDNVNHDAHLYGALFGALYAIVLVPNAFTNFIQQLSQWSPGF